MFKGVFHLYGLHGSLTCPTYPLIRNTSTSSVERHAPYLARCAQAEEEGDVFDVSHMSLRRDIVFWLFLSISQCLMYSWMNIFECTSSDVALVAVASTVCHVFHEK